MSFYLIEKVVDDVSWIPNKHYSGIYGLLKLTLPKILPKHLDKTIVLDTDVTLANDISKVSIYHYSGASFNVERTPYKQNLIIINLQL